MTIEITLTKVEVAQVSWLRLSGSVQWLLYGVAAQPSPAFGIDQSSTQE